MKPYVPRMILPDLRVITNSISTFNGICTSDIAKLEFSVDKLALTRLVRDQEMQKK
jgi:hypothetical protein